ncbi:BamA/TamA family outer membrane protein [Marinigracilibium pacificum]|uniref:BamA/TamA family outer membrane protein n=1 Tax=Marinigracilibium pacificum TaxID=2729599 RepID=A0A848J345_9BACT|nr:BamA/TamA family outer membrane protein [Marinigracilibium pacificum]NMM47602.1 BamA/TamA family outer membrane protein [Marinigracilibium pacificum]
MKRLMTILIIFFSFGCFAQKEEAIYRFDTARLKKIEFVALPVVFSTPETGFGFGGGGQIFIPGQSNIYNNRLSNMLFTAIYTTNKQFILDLKPQLYFGKGNYFFDMAYKFKIYPNQFWGIGPNTPESNEESYDMTSHEFRIALLKRLPPNLNFGFEYIYQNHNVTEVEEGGILDQRKVLGYDKAVISGLGVIFNLDSRDDVSSPFSGHYLQMSARFSSEVFGATTGFNKIITDLRTYFPLNDRSILAAQFYSENTFGEVPFQGASWYGGGDRARGYFKGRFIENQMYVIQAEYRLRFHQRWTVAGFGLVGEVAQYSREFFSSLKPAVGGGIRFKIKKDQSTVVRLDVGVGKEQGANIYFGVNEAF